jgi:predicted RNA binding protein YcfA (HicA-like mRNA interferase family)
MTRRERELKALARQHGGWTVEQTRGGHYRLRHPNGAIVFTPTTPSCHRSLQNTASELRRALRRGRDA